MNLFIILYLQIGIRIYNNNRYIIVCIIHTIIHGGFDMSEIKKIYYVSSTH